MGSRKSSGTKQRLTKAQRSAKSAPRWLDLKIYGMGRARSRAVKRFKSRHWRRDDLGE